MPPLTHNSSTLAAHHVQTPGLEHHLYLKEKDISNHIEHSPSSLNHFHQVVASNQHYNKRVVDGGSPNHRISKQSSKYSLGTIYGGVTASTATGGGGHIRSTTIKE